MTLVEFLKARFDEDEQMARACWGSDWLPDTTQQRVFVHEADEGSPVAECWGEAESLHIARHDPKRVLAEVDAKRKLIAQHPAGSMGSDEGEPFRRCGGEDWAEWPCITLKLLAAPYSDHPDFDPAWRVPDLV